MRQPEATYQTAPTVTTSPTGAVSTSNFPSRRAARSAKVKAILRPSKPQKLPTPVLNAAKKGVSALPSVKAAVRKSARDFAEPLKATPIKAPKATERQAARKTLQQAKRVVSRTTGITGPLTKSQKVFAKQVARETPLKPRTVATQALQEMSGEAAKKRDAEHNYDILNIGYTDSGPLGLTGGKEWSSPKSAARATTEFLEGKKYSPGAGIPDILRKAKGKSVAKQLQIIGNSGWASSEYAKNLAATSALVGEKHNPQAVQNLQEAKLVAKELGLKVGQSPGKPPKQVVTRYQAGLKAAETLAHSHIPYVWGGGHGSIEGAPTGLDCSGAVSWVLNKMGVLKSPLTSGSMGSVLKPGPGAVTVFYNAGHTFMKIGEKYFGTSVNDSSKGLAFYKNPGSAYLSQYSVGHVPGLGKKQAVQLGFKLPSGANAQAFPGMTISSGGTSATINSGASVEKPGFSKRPIKLNPSQKFKKLEQLGVGVSPGKNDTGPSTQTLEALDKKYQAA